MLRSFRFFGLVFILPGVVGDEPPASFAAFAAFGDFATGVLAMLALFTINIRPRFWPLVVGFNLVGTGYEQRYMSGESVGKKFDSNRYIEMNAAE